MQTGEYNGICSHIYKLLVWACTPSSGFEWALGIPGSTRQPVLTGRMNLASHLSQGVIDFILWAVLSAETSYLVNQIVQFLQSQ